PEALRGLTPDAAMLVGYAVTALAPRHGAGAVLVGFTRHDRFQHRFRFAIDGPLAIDVETLWDRIRHDGILEAEPLVLLSCDEVEPALRRWAEIVAAEQNARPARERITGWCSWYSLYASIDEPTILEHFAAARAFRDERQVPLRVFQIDDGFTPEMGDWLEVKPQFPRGMAPLLAEIREAGFIPGLWIAPFMVGNRSRLFRDHPDWVVRERDTGEPLATYRFYGEFRWHKRSEEYYTLDVTHPDAEAYIRTVFRTWARDWGTGYFKTDFMFFGAEYGPDRAVWHEHGLTRIEIWTRMARLIRQEIGEALWLGCGAPLFASVGLVDAIRIGRDVGVTWKGNHSAESLLRDQTARNFGNGILWQADPDCVLLRDRFHSLSDAEVRSLATFAGLSGGVLMTSDHFGELPEDRVGLFAELLSEDAYRCDFPLLGQGAIRYAPGTGAETSPTLAAQGDAVIVQSVRRSDGATLVNVFNTGEAEAERLLPWSVAGASGPVPIATECCAYPATDASGVHVRVPPHASQLLVFGGPTN
ncbi:MAG TPA: glycoside hydrolase family 36 protein, partial [Propylenella sp.]|nr:glycoside hydrolase family 36 protein [Propylenella sp.]